MIERKKLCPVCGGLVAVLNGNPEKYGEKSVGWNRYIALKYCSDECRKIMSDQSKRLSNKRRRQEAKEYRNMALDAVDVLRKEVEAYRQEEVLLRKRIAELEAKL